MIERTIKTAVVTGPTGAIGTALCRVLAESGCMVYAVCRPGSSRTAALPEHERLHAVRCDLSELAELPSCIPAGADAFFHLAWAHTIGPGRNDMAAQIDNIRYTIDAVRAAAELGCKVFVGAGSQAEYGRVSEPLRPDTPAFPENGYGMAKLCAGQMSRTEARRLGVAHVWPRVLSVYGPHDGPRTMISTVIEALLDGRRPALTAGEQMWDYLYAADAAQAFRLMALRGADGAVYPLGSGQPRPLREYIETLRDAIDPALPLGFGEVPYGEGQVMYLAADMDPLRRDTGFEPATSFADGIRQTVDAVRRERHG